MTATDALTAGGWSRDAASGVWTRPEPVPLRYSDGDANEEAVLEALRSAHDRSSGSDELRAMIRDWPTEYHLSPERANLVRPFPVKPGDRVLELGAGCGAITRWLGETGAHVIAVEGSPRRAGAAALRCEDLSNVHVVCDDLLRFGVNQRFEWVFLVGVLEYCRIFASGEAPELQYLGRARSLLSPNGCLVLAIENQLGLKYFAGCGEDHVGRPYYGVHDLYRPGEPVTFGRVTLDGLLSQAGFGAREYLFPMPDYKLPLAIVRETAATDQRLAVGDMLSRGFSRDYSGRQERSFSENLSWQAAARNHLLPDLANSFMVLASTGHALPAKRRPPLSILAWCYSSNRQRHHRVETLFIDDGDSLRVDKRDLKGPASPREARRGPRRRFTRRTGTASYVPGRLLSTEIARYLARHDDSAVVDAALLQWIDELLGRALIRPAAGSASAILLPQDCIDAVPANTLVDDRGRLHFIDLEWVAQKPIPLGWVVLRGLLGLTLSLDDAGAYAGQSTLQLAERVLAFRGIELPEADVGRAVELDESLLREAVFGETATTFPLTARSLRAPIAPRVVMADRALTGDNGGDRRVLGLQTTVHRLETETATLRKMLDDEQTMHAENIAKLKEAAARAHAAQLALADAQHEAREAQDRAEHLERDTTTLRTMLGAEQAMHAENIAKLKETAARAHATGLALARAQQAARDARGERECERERAEAAALKAAHAEAELVVARDVIANQNQQLVALHLERATFGAKIGRWITRQRNRWLPPESRRGRATTLAAKFAESLARDGPGSAVRRSVRYTRSRLLRPALSAGGSLSGTAAPGAWRAMPEELERWIASHESDADGLREQRRTAADFAWHPLITIILPVYKVPEPVLRATLDSFLAQTYEQWEACIAYGDLDDARNWELLETHADRDARIRPFRLNQNSGISGNSNAALARAKGEFVALVDHDDELGPSALFAIVERLNAERDLDFIYTDKDSIDAEGQVRQHALFKPEWSPEMLHSVNYLTHLNVIRRELIEAVGGWRSETDGAQDWDLFFRVTERTRRVARVPGMHYHWRILPTSTATGLQAKPYAALAQLTCQQSRLSRLGLDAAVEPHDESGFRVRWPLPAGPVADIVVRAPADARQLRGCLDTLRVASLEHVARIWVLVPAGTDGIEHVVGDFSAVWGNRIGFDIVDAANMAAPFARIASDSASPLLLFVDGHAAAITPDVTDELCGWVHGQREIGWAAAIALRMDETVVEAGRVVGDAGRSAPLLRGTSLRSWGWFGGALWYRNASAASPYACALRRADVVRVSPYDGETFDPWWLRVCALLQADGRRGLVDPHARVWFAQDPEPAPAAFHESFGKDPYFHPFFRGVAPLRLMP